ncbi:MFS transporter [Siccirubricoccus deserti]|uniref:MFS transporter n=2 Tax=Siccirubricoccus deserti TaxID=2013562 RepID=A0A9X0R3P1_9PROT|nr:MFS transporter [Siccirubricoccus deserti]
MAGSGSLGTAVSLRLEAAELPRPVIGFVMSAYFAGLTLGSLLAYRVVLRVGHIRAFTAFASVVSAVTLLYPLLPPPLAWVPLRLAEGFCMAGIFICVESWLNDHAGPASRGRILAAYMICLYLGQASGQVLLALDWSNDGMRVFLLVSVLISVAVLPVALTRMPPPALPEVASFPARRLWVASPLGVVGTVASGLVLGSVYALGPVFARDAAGFEAQGAALFMGVLITGGVLLQWPLGRLSDAFDRRRVIVATLALLVVAALLVASAAEGGGVALLGSAAFFGGVAFALYPLCAAHTNDHLARDERVAASGGLVLAYSSGATAGPLLTSAVMMALGGWGLFLFAALVGLLGLVFAAWRLFARAPVPAERQGAFQPLPGTTPTAAPLDPRTSLPATGRGA